MSRPRQPIETWREAKGTPTWLFAAMKAMQRWGIGSRCDEATYDSAAQAAAGIRIASQQ